MRGYFGIGIEGAGNAGNSATLFRSAHAFGASFCFTVAADYSKSTGGRADTSNSAANLPFYDFPDVASLLLPQGCALVGVELVDDAVELPSFHHPATAAYVLGRERGSLTAEMLARCDFVVKIPTRFCVNLAIAGSIVCYDRVQSLGRFAPRPVRTGGPTEEMANHVHGQQKFRMPDRIERYRGDIP